MVTGNLPFSFDDQAVLMGMMRKTPVPDLQGPMMPENRGTIYLNMTIYQFSLTIACANENKGETDCFRLFPVKYFSLHCSANTVIPFLSSSMR